ncbi:PTS sugar transporter subunit IIA [Erythrobacter sp. EC-HK427]|uniref:PTS sugar transporter subunit IIA n=1 Tax=Erythrobacter sp. EC-HK427 TaxID=2038396 RepID=UPI00125993D1|nr:PTS sugar transporter subunit IIA [Erythrobacter sp. EC-HK427]VVT03376.1 Phosphotransferase enzyme IIA component [Erythrobacter sp. EC-HK427]
MTAEYLLKPESVAIVAAATKAEILAELAQVFARAWELDAETVQEKLEEREKLGSTGFGRGVAIPHARIEGISRPIIALLKPHKPVDFGAADGLPVDLVIGLLSPENCGATHLHALAAISRLVRDERIHDALTEMSNPEAIYAMLSNATDRDAA